MPVSEARPYGGYANEEDRPSSALEGFLQAAASIAAQTIKLR
ncbi:hypothetical protein QUB57_27635 [Microcoleus sp. F6_C1]